MAVDMLDPGPHGDYPYMPRDKNGYLDTSRAPSGTAWNRGSDGKVTLIDLTKHLPDGRPISAVVPTRPEGTA